MLREINLLYIDVILLQWTLRLITDGEPGRVYLSGRHLMAGREVGSSVFMDLVGDTRGQNLFSLQER